LPFDLFEESYEDTGAAASISTSTSRGIGAAWMHVRAGGFMAENCWETKFDREPLWIRTSLPQAPTALTVISAVFSGASGLLLLSNLKSKSLL